MRTSRSEPHILVAGIGNIFLGDDGFGVEVAHALVQVDLPERVRVIDFGIRGLDLAYTLLEGYEMALLVDAVPRGGKPGTLYLIEPEPEPLGDDTEIPSLQGHNLDPVRVLQLVDMMGGSIERLLVLGCEPAPITSEHDLLDGLSPPVAAAVPQAVALIESLVDKLARGETFANLPPLPSPVEILP